MQEEDSQTERQTRSNEDVNGPGDAGWSQSTETSSDPSARSAGGDQATAPVGDGESLVEMLLRMKDIMEAC